EISGKLEAGTINLTQLVKLSQGIKQKIKEDESKRSKLTLDELKGDGNQNRIAPEAQSLSAKFQQKHLTANLLQQLENKSLFETDKVIASELNITPKTFQKISPQRDKSVRAELYFTE